MKVFYTLVFGINIYEPTIFPYFPGFIKSLQGSSDGSTKFLLIGDTPPPSFFPSLPVHVQFISTSWKDMSERLDRRFHINVSSSYSNITYNYKVADFKPLVPALFPDLFLSSHWIAWIDNDVWISRDFLDLIQSASEDSHLGVMSLNIDYKLSWGPFTAINTTTYFNLLVPIISMNKTILIDVFKNADMYRYYDEWSTVLLGGLGYQHSFSAVLEHAKERYNISILSHYNIFNVAMYQDACNIRGRVLYEKCGYCEMSFLPQDPLTRTGSNRITPLYTHISSSSKSRSRSSSGSSGKSGKRNSNNSIPRSKGHILYNENRTIMSFCHFQKSKRHARRVFKNSTKWRNHLQALDNYQPVASTFLKGIVVVQ